MTSRLQRVIMMTTRKASSYKGENSKEPLPIKASDTWIAGQSENIAPG
jgi:hypothetical protein